MDAPLNAATDSNPDDQFLSAAPILTDLKKRATELQILPSVAIKAMEVARRPDCSISEYSSLVERDLKLTTEVLKLANSALYSPSSPIVSLHQAVMRLGLVQCQNLILTASITSMLKRISSEQKVIREVLGRHGFTTAVIAMHLNQKFRLQFLGEEFTAGLIHDIGRTLLAITRPAQFLEIDPSGFEVPEILDRERRAVGTDHCLLGACFAIYQQLPEPLQEVILYHHQPERATENQKLTALVAVADHMADHMQRYNVTAGYDPGSNPFLPTLAKFANDRFSIQFEVIAAMIMEQSQDVAERML